MRVDSTSVVSAIDFDHELDRGGSECFSSLLYSSNRINPHAHPCPRSERLEAGSLARRQPERVGEKNIVDSRLDEYFCFTDRGERYPTGAIPQL